MKQILIAGINELACYYINAVRHYVDMKIFAILQTDSSEGQSFSSEIPIITDLSDVQMEHIDHVLWCVEEDELLRFTKLKNYRQKIITESQLQLLKPFIENFTEKDRKSTRLN